MSAALRQRRGKRTQINKVSRSRLISRRRKCRRNGDRTQGTISNRHNRRSLIRVCSRRSGHTNSRRISSNSPNSISRRKDYRRSNAGLVLQVVVGRRAGHRHHRGAGFSARSCLVCWRWL